jgi:hypothetical protein
MVAVPVASMKRGTECGQANGSETEWLREECGAAICASLDGAGL